MTNPSPAQKANDVDRRAMLRKLGGTAAVAWAAPSVVGMSRATGMALSGCVTTYDFDDGTLQGWTTNSSGGSSWQVSTLASNSGSHSVWFGSPGTSNSLHPVVGAPSYSTGRPRGTLTSPPTTVMSTDMITFDVRLAIENSSNYDRFRLYIVQGGTRVEIWRKSSGGFSVIDHPQNPGAAWDLYTTLGTFSTQSVTVGTPGGINLSNPVQFEFDFQTVDSAYNRTEGIFLDNVSMPCSATALTADAGASGFGLRSARVGASVAGYLPGYVPPATEQAPAREAPPE